MSDQLCTRCGAALISGYCEYCGWNAPTPTVDKTLLIQGVLCSFTVTKDACTFVPKIGQTAVIANKDIAKIALMLAPTVGTGELSVIAVTGFTQKVTFLSPQNPAVHDAVSYLLHVAPNALFVNLSSQETQSSAPVSKGAACPKCKSANTQTMGESKVFTVWKIIVGVFLIVAGVGSMTPGISPSWVLIIGGAALAANGTPFLSKKKVDCVCMDCRKRFRF